jgi:hypothetical protein
MGLLHNLQIVQARVILSQFANWRENPFPLVSTLVIGHSTRRNTDCHYPVTSVTGSQ